MTAGEAPVPLAAAPIAAFPAPGPAGPSTAAPSGSASASAVASALSTRRRLRWAVHLLLAALGAVAGTSIWGAIPSLWIVALAVGGAATALVTFAIGARFRLLGPELFVAAVAGLLAVGGVAAGPVPTPAAYRDFFRGLIDGWAVLLTSVPPVELTSELQVVPFVGGWLATIVALLLARRARYQGLAVIAPVTVFGLGLLFSVETGLPAAVHGALLIGLSLLTVAATRQSARVGDDSWGNTAAAGRRGRLLSGAVLLAATVGLAPVVANALPGFDERDRYDLRSRLEPPWDPLDEPSPLAQIKANYADEVRDDAVFTAYGDDLPRRWTLATLSHFDGTVWTVGNAELSGRAQFVSIDTTPPGVDQDITGSQDITDTASIRVEIEALDGPWLPTTGRPTQVEVAEDQFGPVELRADKSSATLAIPAGVDGLSYRFDTIVVPSPTEAQLSVATVATPNAPPLELQASSVRDQAADLLEGVDAGWPQVEQISQELRQRGFYRADETTRPGHSWGRLADFAGQANLDGNEEQYAALAAVLARNANLPARIVVGYLVPDADIDDSTGQVTVTRDHASAWIEVHTAEYGWVPVDVTPDRDKRQDVADPGFQTELVTAPNPPPPPPDLQIIEPEQEEDEPEEEEEEDDEVEQSNVSWGRYATVAGTAVGAPVVLGLVWLTLMVGLKARRRRSRRRAKDASIRIVGAWHETNDRIRETGVAFPPHLTTAERAELLELATPGLDSLQPLVGSVDRAAFAAEVSTSEEADRAWMLCDDTVADLKRRHSRRQRLAQAANPAPLIRSNHPRSKR